MKKAVITAGVICLIAILLWGLGKILTPVKGEMVRVEVNGQAVATLPLAKACIYEIKNKDGMITNVLVIENNYAYVKTASCPDGICIHTGKISEPGKIIVCLPNKVVIKVVTGE